MQTTPKGVTLPPSYEAPGNADPGLHPFWSRRSSPARPDRARWRGHCSGPFAAARRHHGINTPSVHPRAKSKRDRGQDGFGRAPFVPAREVKTARIRQIEQQAKPFIPARNQSIRKNRPGGYIPFISTRAAKSNIIYLGINGKPVRPRARGKYHPGMFTDNVRVAFVPAREANTSKYCPDCSACMPFAHAREAKALGRR